MKAYEDQDFIHSADGRIVRVLSEFLEPKRRLKRHRIEDTIVFFGSARTISRKAAEERLAKAKQAPQNEETAEEIRRAKKTLILGEYYDAAVQLAEKMTAWSKALPDKARRFIICSGGGPGMMEAANRGASEAKGISVGLTISMPESFESANEFISKDLNFEFHYFFMRKYWFLYLAKALVIFPGGFGTLDELMEVLTLKQTKKVKKEMPIIIFGSKYWNDVINFEKFVEWGTISEADLKLFHFSDSVDEAFDYLTSELTRIYLT